MRTNYILENKKLRPSSIDNQPDTLLIYLYNTSEQDKNFLQDELGLDLSNLIMSDDHVNYSNCGSNSKGEGYVFNFLYPQINQNKNLGSLIESIVFVYLEDKILIVTDKSNDNITKFLENLTLTDKYSIQTEIIFRMINSLFNFMIDNLTQLKAQIDKLESTVTSSGAIKPVFAELLRLQKHIIVLQTSNEANHQVIDFLKNHFDKSNRKDSETISILYDKNTTVKRMLGSYGAFLDSIESLVNNMSSYQLNIIMQTLTEISITLTIPTIIYGFWGINVHLPFEKEEYGFVVVFIISIILSVIVWAILRHKRNL